MLLPSSLPLAAMASAKPGIFGKGLALLFVQRAKPLGGLSLFCGAGMAAIDEARSTLFSCGALCGGFSAGALTGGASFFAVTVGSVLLAAARLAKLFIGTAGMLPELTAAETLLLIIPLMVATDENGFCTAFVT